MGKVTLRVGAQMGLLCALALGACADKKATAIVVAVSTEGRVPEDISELEIVVERDGQARFSQPYVMPADTRMPGTLTLTREDDSKGPARVIIRAKDSTSKAWRVVREARVGFSDEKTKLLRMPLRFSCFDAGDCPSGSTCVGGTCEDAGVDVETLPDFDSHDAVARTKEQGGCFDEAKCVTAWKKIERAELGDDCSFKPTSSVGAFNIIVEWAAAKGRRVVLEADSREGFTLDGDRVVLAKGICKALTGLPDARARVLGISEACPTKAPNDPVCVDGQSKSAGGAGGASAGGSTGKAGTSGGGAPPAGTGGVAGQSGAVTVDGPDGSKATVPAGATSQSSSIAIKVAIPADIPPIPSKYAQTSTVYAFTPHGMTFAAPVTIEVPGAAEHATPLLLTAPPGGPWAEIQATAVGEDMRATVQHFSFFTVTELLGSGGSSGSGGASGSGGSSGKGGGCGDTQSSQSNCGECGYSCGTNQCKFGVCAGLDLNMPSAHAVLAVDGVVYSAALYGDRISRTPDTGDPTGSLTQIVATPTRPYALLYDAQYVYWHTVGGQLGRVSRVGAIAESIGTGPQYFDGTKSPGTILLDGETIYFTHIGVTSGETGIYSTSISGGAAALLIPLGIEAPQAIFADPSHLYWADQDGTIKRAPKSSLDISSVEVLGKLPNGVRALQQDGTDLLIASADEIHRMPKAGGATTVVTKSKYGITSASLVMHGGQVFYGHSGGRVEHAPLTGGEPHTRCDSSAPTHLFSNGVALFYPTLGAKTFRCDLP